ncbi:MAG TPA: sugar kinase, partial [Verrucomicrobiales bacterium]|nr:sugar kinase [Verrucomicrobiales bacterium]
MKPSRLGIEIGGTKIQVVLGDAGHTIRDRRRFVVDRSQGAAGIRAQIEEAIRSFQTSGALFEGVGVGFGGPVNRKQGMVACSHQIQDWEGFALAAWLNELCHCPVYLDNDANVAALGESVAGAGRGAESVFYMTLGSGVGGGMVFHENIYHGNIPGESELGHLRLDREGTRLEDVCSGWAVDRQIVECVRQHPDSKLAACTRHMQEGQAKALSVALSEGCPLAKRILDETTQALAFGLSHVIHLFHPSRLVVGGGLSMLGAPLLNAVARQLPQWVMEVFHPVPDLIVAQLGEDAVPLGALCLTTRQGALPRVPSEDQ